MGHCTPDEMMAVVDGSRDPASLPHLAVCDRCRDECEQLRKVFAEVREVSMPEPSPLYWEQLSARVHEAVAAERRSNPPEDDARWWHPARFAWPATLVTAAVLGAVFVTPWLLMVRGTSSRVDSRATAHVAEVGRPGARSGEAGVAGVGSSGAGEPGARPRSGGPGASSAADGSDVAAVGAGADESIGLMLELAGSLDVDAVLSAGLAAVDGAADGAVADLSLEERRELERLLREALKGTGA